MLRVDATYTSVPPDELRRRAAEGDQRALGELLRRQGLEVITEPGNGTGGRDWIVRGEWHGARRVLFTGSVFECCHWIRERALEPETMEVAA